MAETARTDVKQGKHLFQPGQSGNPKGRPRGARDRLGYTFVQALQADFEKHGIAAVERVRQERPSDYLKVIASLLPKEFHVKDEAYEDLTDEQLNGLLDEVRSAHARVARAQAATRESEASRTPGSDIVH